MAVHTSAEGKADSSLAQAQSTQGGHPQAGVPSMTMHEMSSGLRATALAS